MRQFLVPSLILSSVLLGGFVTNAGFAINAPGGEPQTLPHYLVVPGAVTGDRTTGINGSFRLTQSSAPNGSPNYGIPGDQLGGACIIFRAQDLRYTNMAQQVCSTDEQCQTGEGQGYCQTSTKTCWARPIADPDPLCKKSGDSNPPQQWPVGQDVNISENPIPVGPYSLQPNAQAVVVALTRAKPSHKLKGVLTWGQPTTIP